MEKNEGISKRKTKREKREEDEEGDSENRNEELRKRRISTKKNIEVEKGRDR